MKQMMNSPSDPRKKIYINRDAEKCLKDLERVLPARNGKPMRYTHIVGLALFYLASHMDCDTLPYVSLLATAFRDVDVNLQELEEAKRECADRILSDPDLQGVIRALETAQELCEACQAEVQRQALASCGNEATLPPVDDCED